MTQPLTLTLTLDQINIILVSLSKQPYDSVVAIIGDIQQQAHAQLPTTTDPVVEPPVAVEQ